MTALSAGDRAAKIKLMAFDIDGVLSDGSLYFTDDGVEIKAFNSVDGLGMNILQQAGVELAIITGRKAACVERRAAQLRIRHLYQGCDDKLSAMKRLLDETGLSLNEVGYMGDDLIDIRVMAACGFAACPQNANDRVRPYAHWVSRYPGGRGAAREVCEFILEAKGLLPAILARFMPEAPGGL